MNATNSTGRDLVRGYLQLKLDVNNLIYESTLFSVWLFVATIGCASLTDDTYRKVAFICTGVFMAIQLHSFVRYRMVVDVRKKIHSLHLDEINVFLNGNESETTTSGRSKSNAPYFMLFSFAVSFLFYLYSFHYSFK